MVKRIAAIAGETITVDGVSYTVPENCYFVLGDNLKKSCDSRCWSKSFVNDTDVIALIIKNNF